MVSLVVLGAMAAVVVLSLQSSTALPTLPTSTTSGGGPHTTTTTGASIPQQALVAACVANAQAVQAAAQDYAIQHAGMSPPRGTAWAHPFLRSWPTSPDYAIAWNGAAIVVRPRHGAVAVGSPGTERPRTGCDAA